MARDTKRPGSRAALWAGATLARGAAFALAWVVLTGEPTGAWATGAPVVLAALALSFALLRPQRPTASPVALLLLAPRLAHAALVAGVDVASRALRPRMGLDPDLVEIEVRPMHPGVRMAMAYVLTLLPGTVAASFTDRGLLLHVLDRGRDNAGMVAWLERRLRGALLRWSRPRRGRDDA